MLKSTPISLNYFATTGIQLFRGREFATTDDGSAPKVAIVNQTFAQRYVGNQNPIGLEFSYADNETNRYQIIGVVSDARVNDIRETAPPIIYFPIAQNLGNIDGLEVRTAADPHWVAAQARQAIADVDPRIPIVNVATLNEEVKDNLTQPRLIARLTTIFGILALTLACLGLYGVMSYTMQRRTSEVGVRLALGSTRPAVIRLVIRETLLLAGFGAVIGLAMAIAGMHMASEFSVWPLARRPANHCPGYGFTSAGIRGCRIRSRMAGYAYRTGQGPTKRIGEAR